MKIYLPAKVFFIISMAVLLSSCANNFSKHYWEEYYTKKAVLFSAELATHGIEIECFKFENKRWPTGFSEMISYEPKVLPCLGFAHKEEKFWQKSPSGIIQGIDEQNALIMITELREKDGSFKALEQAIHVNYHIEYEHHFSRVDDANNLR